MLSTGAGSWLSGKVIFFFKILTYPGNFSQFFKRVLSFKYYIIFMGYPACEEIRRQQYWRNPSFNHTCSVTECEGECTIFDFAVLSTMEN